MQAGKSKNRFIVTEIGSGGFLALMFIGRFAMYHTVDLQKQRDAVMNLESGQLDKAQTMITQGYRVGWRDWRPLITGRRALKSPPSWSSLIKLS